MGNRKQKRKAIFARWAADGYYYPAVIEEVNENQAYIRFLGGTEDWISMDDIVELSDAYATMQLEGDWENRGGYYTCTVTDSSNSSLTVQYDEDGVVEQVDLNQLRCFPVRKKKRVSSESNKSHRNIFQAAAIQQESIAGKYWFTIGGLLLAVFGGIFLINNIITLNSLEPLQNSASGWDKAFRIGVIALPILWIISGVFTFLLGKFGSDKLFTINSRIITPINTISTLILCGYIAAWNAQSLPFFENLGSWFHFPITDTAMWVVALILITAGQLCYVGLEVSLKAWEDQLFWGGGISKPTLIIRAATRLLFIFILIPILKEGLGSDGLKGLPPLVYTYLGMIGMGIFVLVGDVDFRQITVFKVLVQRAKGIIAIIVYIIAVLLVLHPIILWLCNSTPDFIQIGICLLLLMGTFAKSGGSATSSSSNSSSSSQSSDDGNVVCQWCGYRKLANQPYCPSCNNKGLH